MCNSKNNKSIEEQQAKGLLSRIGLQNHLSKVVLLGKIKFMK